MSQNFPMLSNLLSNVSLFQTFCEDKRIPIPYNTVDSHLDKLVNINKTLLDKMVAFIENAHVKMAKCYL